MGIRYLGLSKFFKINFYKCFFLFRYKKNIIQSPAPKMTAT